MEMTNEQLIDAPRDRVWFALNDPDILRQCIPGCRSLEKIDGDRMHAVADVKVGPIGARFTGDVTFSEVDPPNGYFLQGEGQGGAVGFAKGGARVRLIEQGETTLLTYEVSAQVGGKLAQLGGPIINATAKQMAGVFFRKFSEVIVAPPAGQQQDASVVEGQSKETVPATTGQSAAGMGTVSIGLSVAWGLAVLVALLAGALLGRGGDYAWLAVGALLIVVAIASYLSGRITKAPKG